MFSSDLRPYFLTSDIGLPKMEAIEKFEDIKSWQEARR